jgi:hypothetical protein
MTDIDTQTIFKRLFFKDSPLPKQRKKSSALRRVAKITTISALVLSTLVLALNAILIIYLNSDEALAIGTGTPMPIDDSTKEFFDQFRSGTDPLSKLISAPLRELCNLELSLQSMLIYGFSQDTYLTGAFSELFSGIWGGSEDLSRSLYKAIFTIHHIVVMPLAYCVMLVSFMFYLSKLFYEASSHESGIDLFRMVLGFVILFFVKCLVDNSWQLMQVIYAVINHLTAQIPASAHLSSLSAGRLSEDFTNISLLILVQILIFLGVILLAVCMIIAKVSLVVRAATIYLYVAFSPLALATAVTDSGRAQAITFAKKFAAQVLAGAVMLVFFMMLSFALQSMQSILQHFNVASPLEAMQIISIFLTSYIPIIGFTMLISKSGKLAGDIIGIG